jgi:hypothetical protein
VEIELFDLKIIEIELTFVYRNITTQNSLHEFQSARRRSEPITLELSLSPSPQVACPSPEKNETRVRIQV